MNTEKNQEYESPETLACKLIKTQELQYSMTTFDKRILCYLVCRRTLGISRELGDRAIEAQVILSGYKNVVYRK